MIRPATTPTPPTAPRDDAPPAKRHDRSDSQAFGRLIERTLRHLVQLAAAEGRAADADWCDHLLQLTLRRDA